MFGRLDVPFEDISFEQWSAVVNVKLTGAFLCPQGGGLGR
jgi:hypothetical protein